MKNLQNETFTLNVLWGTIDQFGNWGCAPKVQMSPEEQYKKNIESVLLKKYREQMQYGYRAYPY